MKKPLIFIIVFFGLAYIASAQVNPHALGLRFGGNGNINSAEISYQHGLTDANRMELDLGFGASSTQTRLFVIGIYHWDWIISRGLNWYIGPGVGAGFYAFEDAVNYINVALGGQAGIEFDFNTMNVPFLLSVDVRPMWDFLGHDAGLGWGAALGVRYTW